MNLQSKSIQNRILFPYFPDRKELLERSAEQASALPIGSSRGTKGSGARR
jgi:hypothetical protein